MDVTIVFLHGNFNEEMYMDLSQEYTGIDNRICGDHKQEVTNVINSGSRLVCKLVKSLYGLKHAPRCWFTKLTTTLKGGGFVHLKADYSLLTKIAGNTITLILIYVDDLLFAGNSTVHNDQLKNMLSSNFHMNDLGSVSYFLGLEVQRSAKGIFISQKTYVIDLLKDYHVVGIKPSKLPLSTKLKLAPTKWKPLYDPQQYQKLLGKFTYLTVTRPDIVHSVHILT